MVKNKFSYYTCCNSRDSGSRKLIENGGPNGAKKSSKLRPWAAKVSFFEICTDFVKIDFLMFFRSAKRRAKITIKSALGRNDRPENGILEAFWKAFIIQGGHCTGRF